MDKPTWEEMYWKLNDATMKQILNLKDENAAMRQRLARLDAAVSVAFDYVSFMSDSDRDIIVKALRGGR